MCVVCVVCAVCVVGSRPLCVCCVCCVCCGFASPLCVVCVVCVVRVVCVCCVLCVCVLWVRVPSMCVVCVVRVVCCVPFRPLLHLLALRAKKYRDHPVSLNHVEFRAWGSGFVQKTHTHTHQGPLVFFLREAWILGRTLLTSVWASVFQRALGSPFSNPPEPWEAPS